MILAHDVTGSGPLLVLIHGITEDRSTWDPIDLTDAFTVLRVDLRGHGDSDAAAPYDIPTLAADVRETVESVAPGAVPWVVGHSMGGIVATAYGAMFPVAGVVNVDQPLHLEGMQQQVLQAEGMLRGDQFPLFIAGMFEQMSGALDESEKQRVSGIRSPQQEVVLGMWRPLLEDSPEQLGETVAQVAALPPDTPYVVITGLDPGPEYAAWLQQLVPQTVHEVWTPPTHYPHLADPERFTARVKELVGV